MTAEKDGADLADPSSSALAHFGAEVRLEREALGMSRKELGREATCGYSMVAKVEAGDRVPPREFAEACDRVFPHANGRFMRLWPFTLKYAYPQWFQPYVELEKKATKLRFFNSVVVPGLAQTEGYARAVLRTGRLPNFDDVLTARMERQRILAREHPPRLWLVLDREVIRRVVGGPEVMREQLKRLRELAEAPPHVVQFLPDKPHHGHASPFALLSFHEGADVVHVDGFPTGYVVADTEPVEEARAAYDLLAATACSPEESAAVIDSAMKDV